MRRMKLLFALTLVITFCITAPPHASAAEMTIAVIPQMPISEIYERWRPFLGKMT